MADMRDDLLDARCCWVEDDAEDAERGTAVDLVWAGALGGDAQLEGLMDERRPALR